MWILILRWDESNDVPSVLFLEGERHKDARRSVLDCFDFTISEQAIGCL